MLNYIFISPKISNLFLNPNQSLPINKVACSSSKKRFIFLKFEASLVVCQVFFLYCVLYSCSFHFTLLKLSIPSTFSSNFNQELNIRLVGKMVYFRIVNQRTDFFYKCYLDGHVINTHCPSTHYR